MKFINTSKLNNRTRHVVWVVVFYASLFIVFFSPAFMNGALLAPGGDGINIYLPNFYARKVLWDTLLLSGFPMFADPQVMHWYPPSLLFSMFGGNWSWNVFILLAYLAASCFMYGYVYRLTESRLAGLISGIIFGLSGYMISHLSHTVIIHAAAWIPLILWSFEELRRKWSAGWFLAGVVAVTCSFLGGHTQIFFYGLLLSVGYAVIVGWSAPVGRWRYFSICSLIIILSIGLAAIQILPTAELVGQSVRTEFSFSDFASHSLPPKQALAMIFPAAFGGLPAYGTTPYFGGINLTELTGYIGLLPLMLAAIGFVTSRQRRLSYFWLGVVLLAFLLTLGDATYLARIIYHLPILNRFRAPARHFLEVALAVSVLAGLGVAAIQRQEVTKRLVVRTILIGSAIVLACLAALLIFSDHFAAMAAQKGAAQLTFLPWANKAVSVPLLVFLLSAMGLICWHRRSASLLVSALFVAVLVFDLASFGWFDEWRYSLPDKSTLSAPVIATRYRDSLNATNQRLLPLRGAKGKRDEMPPDRSRLWGVPSASGYNVLILSRVSHLLSMIERGDVPPLWEDANDQSVNIMAIRYFILPNNKVQIKTGVDASWLAEDMTLWLGPGCNPTWHESVTFDLPAPVNSTSVGIVSRLACSASVPDGTEVARVSLTDANGEVYQQSMVAGRDTAEWAYDCGSVKPLMKHQRATIFNSYPAEMYNEPCEGHRYVAILPLTSAKDIKSITIEWVGEKGGAMILEKASLINDSTKSSKPISALLSNTNNWRSVEETDEARIYENLRVMPRVWLVPEVSTVKPEEALSSIKTSKMPDGRTFDPSKIALIEEPLAFEPQQVDAKPSAEVAHLSDTTMEVRTASSSPSFLVTSDPYYPGWQVSIDGQPAHLFQADYALRGVALPPGQHLVRFEFRPSSFYYGAVISAIALLALLAIISKALFFKARPGAVSP
ncbi:MAG TPA: YfhO family protein [Pyrinomonadaceae bacterium]|jgi:hypothetical protein|nr:YfhO family protein [Pyrinomonadaceae bacterium]